MILAPYIVCFCNLTLRNTPVLRVLDFNYFGVYHTPLRVWSNFHLIHYVYIYLETGANPTCHLAKQARECKKNLLQLYNTYVVLSKIMEY